MAETDRMVLPGTQTGVTPWRRRENRRSLPAAAAKPLEAMIPVNTTQPTTTAATAIKCLDMTKLPGKRSRSDVTLCTRARVP